MASETSPAVRLDCWGVGPGWSLVQASFCASEAGRNLQGAPRSTKGAFSPRAILIMVAAFSALATTLCWRVRGDGPELLRVTWDTFQKPLLEGSTATYTAGWPLAVQIGRASRGLLS